MRKYSCSGPHVVTTRSAVEPNSFNTRTACFESASIERSSGVFLSSASPVQLTNAVGMTSVVELPLLSSHGGLVGSHAARRKARRVRLAADQFLAGELRHRLAVAGRREKRVVLLRGNPGQRLE